MSTPKKQPTKVLSATEEPTSTRGAFILFEGCDRVGKSTQCSMLVDYLKKEGHDVELFRFPDRDTQVGKTIDAYLQNKANLNDRVVHLMFSMNRHECSAKILTALAAGKTIVCDRYVFSGVAYTMSKGEEFSYDWCMMPDVGLPAPDIVLFLDMDIEQASKRSEYGGERYERLDLQKRIRANFLRLKAATAKTAEHRDGLNWKMLDATKPIPTIHQEICAAVAETVPRVASEPVRNIDMKMVFPERVAKMKIRLPEMALEDSESSSPTPLPAPALTSPGMVKRKFDFSGSKVSPPKKQSM